LQCSTPLCDLPSFPTRRSSDLVPDARSAVKVEDGVACDPKEPGRGCRRPGLEAVVGLVGPDENLGGHVFSLGRVAQLAERVAVDARQELAVEVLELRPRGHAASW